MTRTPGKCGCKPPKRAECIKLGDHLTGADIPPHPVSQDWLALLSNWMMLLNDRYGCCVAVTWANIRRLVVFMATGQDIYPGEDQVIKLYRTQNPLFPLEDGGMEIQTTCEQLVKVGGPDGVKALGFASVDLTNEDEVNAAIAIFGYVWTGIEVEKDNLQQFQNSQPFDDDGSDVEGGHSVITAGYGDTAQDTGALAGDRKFITWAQETSFTKKYWDNRVQQGWVVIWPEMVNDPAFLAGVNLDTFKADYKQITGNEFPEITASPSAPDQNSYPPMGD